MTEDLARYNPMDPAMQQDPFPHYARLREEAPVYLHPSIGIYFVSRLDTVRHVLGDTKTYSSSLANSASAPPKGVMAELKAILSEGYPVVNTMLTADPPIQSRYRKTVGRTFTTKRIQSFEPPIREIARDLVAAWPESGEVDVQHSFSIPLPVKSIALLLGMDPAVEGEIKRWSDDSVAAIGARLTDERRLEAARGIVELQKYWAGEFEDRLEHPREDFITAVTKSTIEDESGDVRRLDMPEMLSIIQQLMVAGNETTTKLISEMLKILATRPDQWKRLREDLTLSTLFVEEALRLASPNQGLFRRVTQDTELEGVKIPEGATVWVMFGAANRDERFFPDPDRFVPERENLREHVALGFGAHFCIGAPLARLEAKVALEEVAKRVETLTLPEQSLEYLPGFVLRGLVGLSLQVG